MIDSTIENGHYNYTPYVFVGNNPIIFVDPDGRKVKGVNEEDAQKAQEDFHTLFADDKFENLNNLISLGKNGKTFNKIGSDDLTAALDGVDLSEDEQALVDEVVGAINSKDVHKVEYLDMDAGEEISVSGETAIVNHFNNNGIPVIQYKAANIKSAGGTGLNVPTSNGSHSFILEGSGFVHDGGRAVTSDIEGETKGGLSYFLAPLGRIKVNRIINQINTPFLIIPDKTNYDPTKKYRLSSTNETIPMKIMTGTFRLSIKISSEMDPKEYMIIKSDSFNIVN